MYVRPAKTEDLHSIMDIIASARQLLAQDGSDQWQNGEGPNEEILKADIDKQWCQLLIHENKIIGTATLMTEADPFYQEIYAGHWLYPDQPYTTIHRLALDPSVRGQGISRNFVSHLLTLSLNQGYHFVRIDTHPKNRRLQALAASLGFIQSGIIYVAEKPKGLRYVYEKALENN